MKPNDEMCKGCFWWRDVQTCGATSSRDKACHKLMVTGERWVRGEDGCLSKKLRRSAEK